LASSAIKTVRREAASLQRAGIGNDAIEVVARGGHRSTRAISRRLRALLAVLASQRHAAVAASGQAGAQRRRDLRREHVKRVAREARTRFLLPTRARSTTG